MVRAATREAFALYGRYWYETFALRRMPVEEVIASGGGVRNTTLMGYLQAFLPDVRIARSDEFGIDADAKEAVAFALLGYLHVTNRPGNVPTATGSRGQRILGKLTPA